MSCSFCYNSNNPALQRSLMFSSTSSELLVIKQVTPFLHGVSVIFRIKGRVCSSSSQKKQGATFVSLGAKRPFGQRVCLCWLQEAAQPRVCSEAALSHTGWDVRFLLAVLPVALLCKSIFGVQQHKLVTGVPADRQVEKRTGCLSMPGW